MLGTGGTHRPAQKWTNMLKSTASRYLISDALSLLGNSIAGVVLPLVLLARTGDVLAAGSLALICAGPQFICGILGGALLDRVNRKLTCVVSDLISALAVALLPIVDATFGLSFGWFAALGLLGAVGDVPGMTARDALLPEVCGREGVELQRFVGASQSIGSLITIAGPAVAALLIGAMPDVDALWVTAACSFAAALVTLTLPKGVGAIAHAREVTPASETHPAQTRTSSAFEGGAVRSLLNSGRSILANGLTALFVKSRLLRASTLLSFCLTMVMASWQGIILPTHFTEAGTPELTGVFVSAMGLGMLVGSMGYTACSHLLSRRAWLCASLMGTAAAAVVMSTLPNTALLLISAAALGLFAGPASALLSFFAFDLVDDSCRGAAMGTLNALYLIVAPLGTFAGSALITLIDIYGTCFVLGVLWICAVAAALITPALRDLGDAYTHAGVQDSQKGCAR
ncbi:MAG: MFS transporter [Coriobacteriaceae bacterium]|nr:MFS transporter [Coriobacteriaceae bacterium]